MEITFNALLANDNVFRFYCVCIELLKSGDTAICGSSNRMRKLEMEYKDVSSANDQTSPFVAAKLSFNYIILILIS